jgi:hypothetical protein
VDEEEDSGQVQDPEMETLCTWIEWKKMGSKNLTEWIG